MTTELTKAEQQALEALKHGVAQLNGIGIPLEADPLHTAITALERALTQRPAAQTEREAFEAWARPNGYDLRTNAILWHYSSIDTLRAWNGWQARASLPAPQQATPATPEDMKVYDGIAAGYFADTQQATPEPVGEVVAYREKLTGRLCEPEDTHRRKFPMCYEPLTRPAPGVPEGFALAPVEPTPAMKSAGIEVEIYNEAADRIGALTWHEVASIYRAMLAAAQAKGVV